MQRIRNQISYNPGTHQLWITQSIMFLGNVFSPNVVARHWSILCNVFVSAKELKKRGYNIVCVEEVMWYLQLPMNHQGLLLKICITTAPNQWECWIFSRPGSVEILESVRIQNRDAVSILYMYFNFKAQLHDLKDRLVSCEAVSYCMSLMGWYGKD